jgi:hypothetical protein
MKNEFREMLKAMMAEMAEGRDANEVASEVLEVFGMRHRVAKPIQGLKARYHGARMRGRAKAVAGHQAKASRAGLVGRAWHGRRGKTARRSLAKQTMKHSVASARKQYHSTMTQKSHRRVLDR